MFEPLDETIKHDEAIPAKERVTKWIMYVIIAVVLFGGLYLLVRSSE